MSASDIELVSRIRAGDDDAFTELYYRYVRLVLAILRKMGVADRDLQDAAQEVFVDLYRQAVRGNFLPRKLSGHLSKLSIWKALDYHDRIRRTPSTPQDELDPTIPISTQTRHEELEEDEFRNDVLKTLRSLPREYREALILKDCEELSYENVADILGIKVSAAKMRVLRARSAFRQAYSGDKSVTRGMFSRLISRRLKGEGQ